MLHQPLRSFLLCVVLWTTIGLVVSAVFFSRSLAAVLPFFLLGHFTGVLLPRFLRFKCQERSLAARRGASIDQLVVEQEAHAFGKGQGGVDALPGCVALDRPLEAIECHGTAGQRPDTDGQGEAALRLLVHEDRGTRGPDGQVVGIVEDRDASDSERSVREINTGILAAGAASLRRWLGRIDESNAQGERYLTGVIALAVADGVGVISVSPGTVEEVLGVNDRSQLAKLERHYQRRQAERLMRDGVTIMDPTRLDIRGEVDIGRDVSLDVNVILEGKVVIAEGASIGPNCVIKNAEIGPDSEIHANTVIEQATIGAGCRIGPYARLRPGTTLAEDVHIGNFVEVKNTRVGRGSKANHLTYLGDSQVGQDVNVGAGTITCNYDGAEKHATIIEDNVFVGSGVELVAPITLHAGATIGAGATVTKDVPPGVLSVNRGRQTTIEDWTRPTKKKSG